jgi:hypothetical protein
MPKGGVSPRVRKRLERDFEAKRRERERERARRRREGALEREAEPGAGDDGDDGPAGRGPLQERSVGAPRGNAAPTAGVDTSNEGEPPAGHAGHAPEEIQEIGVMRVRISR